MSQLKRWMSNYAADWLAGDTKKETSGRDPTRPLLGDDEGLMRGMSSGLSPFEGGPDTLEERLSCTEGPSEERVHPLGTVRVEYLEWYKPPRDVALSFYQEMMATSPFCTHDDKAAIKSMDLHIDRKAQALYFEGLFSYLQRDIMDHEPELPAGLFMCLTSKDERDDFVGGSKTLETAFYHELACEERSLHGFAEACRVEFLSALGAFGVRKLGQLQTSAVVSSIALSYGVHQVLSHDMDKDKSDHAKRIHISIHGTEQMILRGSDSVEFMEELWRLTWVEDVLKVIQKQDGGRQVARGDWIRRVDMEAYVVTIPYAAARQRRGLLYTIAQQVQNEEDVLQVFGDPAVQAVVEYKWAAFGRHLVAWELSLYCLWLFSFVTYLTTIQAASVDPGSTAEGFILFFNLVAFISMSPFMVIEALQIYNSRFLNWVTDFWNFVDLTMMAIQWFCVFERSIRGRDQDWFRAALAVQVVLLVTKAQYFSRAFSAVGGSLVDSIRSVIYEIRWFLGSIALFVTSFTFAFHIVLGKSMDQGGTERSALGQSFNNILISFVTLFAYMLGDFDLQEFTYNEKPYVATLMFMIFEIVMALIVLNLLIAVMTEAYQRAASKKQLMLTASRAEMILELENLGLSDWVYGPKPPKFLHFLKMASSNSDSLEPAETYQDGQPADAQVLEKHLGLSHDKQVSNTAIINELDSRLNQLRFLVQDLEALQRNDAISFLGHEIKSIDENEWKEGDYLRSTNGNYEAIFSNGAIKFFNVQTGRCGWSLGITGCGIPPRKLILKADGDFVMQDRQGDIGWSTGSIGRNADYILTLVDDGSFQLKDDSGRLSWFGPDMGLLSSLHESGYVDREMPSLTTALDDDSKFSTYGCESIELRDNVSGSSLGPKIVSHIEQDVDIGAEDYLLSENKWYKAVLEELEGRIVVYDQRVLDTVSRMPHIHGRQVWSSSAIPCIAGVVGVRNEEYKIRFCKTGSLQIVAIDMSGKEQIVWQSHPGDADLTLMPYKLELLDDRNLVISSSTGEMVWYSSGRASSQGRHLGNSIRASFTMDQFDHLLSLNGCYKAIMQEDGEFALYQVQDSKLLWGSDSKRSVEEGPFRLEVTDMGDMQILSRDRVIKQISVDSGGRHAKGPFTLIMEDDGMLALYQEGEPRTRVWDKGRSYNAFRPLGDSLKCTGSSSVRMVQGDMLVSQNKKYRFKLEPRGMAAVYTVDRNGSERRMNQIDGRAYEEPFYLEVCRDGNLKIWCSTHAFYDAKTTGGIAPYRLMMLNNGAVQLCDARSKTLWDIRYNN